LGRYRHLFSPQPVGSIGLVLVLIFGLAGSSPTGSHPTTRLERFLGDDRGAELGALARHDQLGRDLMSRILFGARTASSSA